MKVQPVLVLGTKHLSLLKESLHSDLSVWASAWFSGKLDVFLDISIQDGFEIPKNQGSSVGIPVVDNWAAFSLKSAAADSLGLRLLGAGQGRTKTLSHGSLLYEVLRHAFQNLVQRFMRSEKEPQIVLFQEGRNDPATPNVALKQGKRFLECKVHLDREASFTLWMLAESLGPRLLTLVPAESRGDLFPLRSSVADQHLTASVVLGEAELTIDSLAVLKVGDVIRLDKSLQEHLSLVFEESKVRFKGYLGKQENMMVFKVDNLEN